MHGIWTVSLGSVYEMQPDVVQSAEGRLTEQLMIRYVKPSLVWKILMIQFFISSQCIFYPWPEVVILIARKASNHRDIFCDNCGAQGFDKRYSVWLYSIFVVYYLTVHVTRATD